MSARVSHGPPTPPPFRLPGPPPRKAAAPPPADPPADEWADPAGTPAYARVKCCVDLVLGVGLLVLFAPVILVAAVAVRLTSAGPAFYSQLRVGKGGRIFRIYKLRTMYHNCELVSGARWSTPGDPRITPLGAVLRKTHVDELPQLFNVLRGEMSLVGPRPERPEIVPMLVKAIPHYRERLRVRPGVTGLAQLRLPADTDVESVKAKLAFDLHYIRTISLWLDLRLMACTFLKMCKLPLGGALRLSGIPGDAEADVPKAALAAEPT